MTKRVHYLDAGRGLAALLVAVHHLIAFFEPVIAVRLQGARPAMQVLQFISELNFHAVMFFFFISGWSIFLSLKQIQATNTPAPWRVYLWRRARRILPMYWLALLWAWALALIGKRHDLDLSAGTLVGNLLFLQTPPTLTDQWFVPFAGNGPLWSLSYEAWYYLALPSLLYFVIPRLPQHFRHVELGLVISLSIGVLAIGANRMAPNPLMLFTTLSPIWFAGYIFASCPAHSRQETRVVIILIAAIIFLTGLREFVRSDTLTALCTGYSVAASTAIAVWLSRRTQLTGFLSRPPFRSIVGGLAYLGLGSFALYVLHYPILGFFLHSDYVYRFEYACLALTVLVLVAPILETRLQARINGLRLPRATRG